jgi:diadenosine tetraphosphate (Ap4A) HIT family hydrolase
MATGARLKKFITQEMKMSQVYQPVMLIELLRNGGTASIKRIAEAILRKDPTQIEYFSEIVKNMVGKVLTKSRGITRRVGNEFQLIDSSELSKDDVLELIKLCETKIADFEEKRGSTVWSHRRRGHRPISGSIRYEVLKRATFRCELCGISADEKNLEVDHIHPKSLGGSDELNNFQALCYSCNAAKRNTDDTDFRDYKKLYGHRITDCLFCNVQSNERVRIISENELAYVIRDGYPVTKGHSLIIPKRHAPDYFSLSQAEINAANQLIQEQKQVLEADDAEISGFNIGINNGETAGQTIFHCHIHLIPRRKGDMEDPRGGVRHVIPERGNYKR